MLDYWLKQGTDKPSFEDLLWSRPGNKQFAGKLLIAGGNQFGFVEPAEAYRAAESAGIGVVRMVLPDSLRRYVGTSFTGGELAPSTPSGSLSQQALGIMLSEAEWSDGVLLAGGLGRNSETAILLEKFEDTYAGQLTITKDAADYFTAAPQKILSRPDTVFVISLAQLQKLASSAKFPKAITFGMDLIRLVELLHDFTSAHTVCVITKHLDNLIVASGGQVSTTKLYEEIEIWRVRTAAYAATWWLQNPGKPFESLTTAVFESIQKL